MKKKIIILIFIGSFLGCGILAFIAHTSIMNTAQKNAEAFWRQQLPVLETVIKRSYQDAVDEFQFQKNKKNPLNLNELMIEKFKLLFSILAQKNPNADISFLEAKQTPKLLLHSREQINQFIVSRQQNKNAAIADLEVIEKTAQELISKITPEVSKVVESKSGQTSILMDYIFNKNKYYIYIVSPYGNYLVKIILFYFVAFLISLLLTLIGVLLVKEAELPLREVVQSLLEFINTGRKIPVKKRGNDAIGELIYRYNNILEDLQVELNPHLVLPSSARKALLENSAAVVKDQAIDQLQNKLFEKPFEPFKEFQLTMYPRNPHAEEKNFIAGKQYAGEVRLLLGRFENYSLEASLEKNIIQEAFWALSESSVDFDIMAKQMWKKFQRLRRLNPELLLLHLNKSAHKLQMLICGDYVIAVFKRGVAGRIPEFESRTLDDKIKKLEEIDLAHDEKLMIFSPEILELLGFSRQHFGEKIIGELVMDGEIWADSKKTLHAILAKIYSNLSVMFQTQKIPGIVTVLNRKDLN